MKVLVIWGESWVECEGGGEGRGAGAWLYIRDEYARLRKPLFVSMTKVNVVEIHAQHSAETGTLRRVVNLADPKRKTLMDFVLVV
jgi:hypothetical protein